MASFFLMLLLPYFVFVPIWIKIVIPGPTFFTRERKDATGRLTRTLVFRTIPVDKINLDNLGDNEDMCDEDIYSIHDVPKFGKFLRRTGLRALPVFISVLRGDINMSSVINRDIATKLAKEIFEKKNL